MIQKHEGNNSNCGDSEVWTAQQCLVIQKCEKHSSDLVIQKHEGNNSDCGDSEVNWSVKKTAVTVVIQKCLKHNSNCGDSEIWRKQW